MWLELGLVGERELRNDLRRVFAPTALAHLVDCSYAKPVAYPTLQVVDRLACGRGNRNVCPTRRRGRIEAEFDRVAVA